jgi:hypothetical protein
MTIPGRKFFAKRARRLGHYHRPITCAEYMARSALIWRKTQTNLLRRGLDSALCAGRTNSLASRSFLHPISAPPARKGSSFFANSRANRLQLKEFRFFYHSRVIVRHGVPALQTIQRVNRPFGL